MSTLSPCYICLYIICFQGQIKMVCAIVHFRFQIWCQTWHKRTCLSLCTIAAWRSSECLLRKVTRSGVPSAGHICITKIKVELKTLKSQECLSQPAPSEIPQKEKHKWWKPPRAWAGNPFLAGLPPKTTKAKREKLISPWKYKAPCHCYWSCWGFNKRYFQGNSLCWKGQFPNYQKGVGRRGVCGFQEAPDKVQEAPDKVQINL